MGIERRKHTRFDICFPVRLDSSKKAGRIGMSRNSSVGGMLLGTPSRFQAGDALRLTFRVAAAQAAETIVRGRVVRVGFDETNLDSWCRRLLAIEFDEPLPDLVPWLEQEAPRQHAWYGPIEAPPSSLS
jgi:hypothetical protein